MGRPGTERVALAAVLVSLWQGAAFAEPVQVSWADLRANRPASCATLLENYQSQPQCRQQAASARLLSSRYQACAPGVDALDGKIVRIAGYAHPLEFEFRGVKNFLLIPPLRQDCSHPPPPLPDQVIAVDFPDGMNVTADPVWVTGTLHLEPGKTHIVTTTYTLRATAVTPANIPDVDAGN